MIPFLYPDRDTGPANFAEPSEASGYGEALRDFAVNSGFDPALHIGRKILERPGDYADLFTGAERLDRVVGDTFSAQLSREEAYDRRIKAVKDATGIELDNPERGSLKGLPIAQQLAASFVRALDPRQMQRTAFEQKLSDIRAANPDKADALQFGSIDDEARAIAKGAEDEYEQARSKPGLDPLTSMATSFAGGMWGQRRDPLFVGTMFAGPTTAAGKTVAARILSAGMRQGFFNAGIAALEQPAVQKWRDEIGVKSGVVPAIENIGMAFLGGFIPGVALRGVHEAGTPAIRRILEGKPQPGDISGAAKAVGDVPPVVERAANLGDEIDAADRVTQPAPTKDAPPELRQDLTAAALRHAEDPVNEPSPAGVAAVSSDLARVPEDITGYRIGGAHTAETADINLQIAERIREANPQSLRDAQLAASEAIEDIGNRADMDHTRAQMQADRLPEPPPPVEGEKPAPARSKDPLDKIPIAREDGTPQLVSARQAAKAGERETQFAELVRACK